MIRGRDDIIGPVHHVSIKLSRAYALTPVDLDS